jgi:phytoene synthase
MSELISMRPADEHAARVCRSTIRRHSSSFALSGALLDRRRRRNAFALYAWCRLADDAVDLVAPERTHAALQQLRRQLDDVYAGVHLGDPVAAEFQRVVHECKIARYYPEQLLAGLAMDADRWRYRTTAELMLYCFRVAGTVGAMMCHVLGIKSERALVNAAHLGMAMQLTNICRDVSEDWQRGRLYLPTAMIAAAGAPTELLFYGEVSDAARSAVGATVAALLKLADDLYASADAGLRDLEWRAAFSIQVARLVYSAIGQRLVRARYDVWRGRMVVPLPSKILLVARALLAALGQMPRRLSDPRGVALPRTTVSFPDVIVYS